MRHLFCLLLCLCAICRTTAQNLVEPPFTLTEVGPNVWAAISNPKSPSSAGANTGFVIGDDAVLVVDTTPGMRNDGTFDATPAKELLAAIRRLTPLPVKFVVNTHHHFDHLGANALFVNAGATVLAHHNARTWTHSENLRLMGPDAKPEHKTFIEALVPPLVTYDHEIDLHLGSREIRVFGLPGHTGGDSVVVIPDAKVVFTGDLFWRNILPNLVDASTLPWIETLGALVANNPDAAFVPGHGNVGTTQDVSAFREYLVVLRTLVSRARGSRKPGTAVADAVMPALAEQYRGWEGFEYLARPNILDVESELNGTKRIPQAGRN